MSPAELREILRETQKLLANSVCWTERNFAEDELGRWVPVGSQRAVRFNLAGALIKMAGPRGRDAMQALAELLCQAPAGIDTLHWRHARGMTHAHALELLQWALAHVENPRFGARRGPIHPVLESPETSSPAGLKASQ